MSLQEALQLGNKGENLSDLRLKILDAKSKVEKREYSVENYISWFYSLIQNLVPMIGPTAYRSLRNSLARDFVPAFNLGEISELTLAQKSTKRLLVSLGIFDSKENLTA